jgi:DNA-binding IclR family transcriptional regulator
MMVAPAPISDGVVSMLVRLGWLDEQGASDRFAVGRALAAMGGRALE